MNIAEQESPDHYSVLEVERTASEAKIMWNYRKLAREFHPDVNPGNHERSDKFVEINEAYQVLGDPARRKKYDEECSQKTRRAAQEEFHRRAAHEQSLRDETRQQSVTRLAHQQFLHRAAQEQSLRSGVQAEMLHRDALERTAIEAAARKRHAARPWALAALTSIILMVVFAAMLWH